MPFNDLPVCALTEGVEPEHAISGYKVPGMSLCGCTLTNRWKGLGPISGEMAFRP